MDMARQALADLIIFLAGHIKAFEIKRARGNAEKLQEINSSSNDEIVRKALWVTAILGAPVCFIAAPFILSMVQPFIWPWLALSLWIGAKVLMVAVFFVFVLAAVFTLKSSN